MVIFTLQGRERERERVETFNSTNPLIEVERQQVGAGGSSPATVKLISARIGGRR